MGTEIVRSEGFMGASPPAADSISPAADSVPACRSAPSIAQPPLPTTEVEDSAGGCTACGRDVEPLHRLRKDEAICNFCSACVLFLYKGMYCCLCFVVYENSVEQGDPALWLTCAKCQRRSHLACAHDYNLPTESVLFTCRDCSKLEKASSKDTCMSRGGMTENGSPPLKKLRFTSDPHISSNEALAAAHIVAVLAVKQAKDAKARARAMAGAAASAAARAKSALDAAYRVALEEARWKLESFRRFPGVLPGKNRGLPSLSVINTPRISKADGRVSMPNLPHLHLHAPSHKDQLRKESASLGYAPRFSAPYNKARTFPPSTEALKSSSTSQTSFQRSVVFQKPQAVCVQGVVDHNPSIELEGAIVSASPASILDVCTSLDTPRLNLSSTGSVSVNVGIPEASGKTNSPSMVLTRSDSCKDKSQLPVSKDQPSVIDKRAEDTSVAAP